jgi:dihydrofolate synthase / folylpolyglutamate synthase
MIACLLAAAGENSIQINHSFISSPLERLGFNGRAASAEQAQELFGEEAERLLARADGLDLVERCRELGSERWLVLSGIGAVRTEVAVFAPIFASGATPPAAMAETACALIPSGGLAVTALQRDSVLDVLRAQRPGLIEVASSCRLARGRLSLDGQEARFRTQRADYQLHLPVLGSFQIENLATALVTVDALAEVGVDLKTANLSGAFEPLRLPGRLELIKRSPMVLVDCGESPSEIRRAVEGLRELASGRGLQAVIDARTAPDPRGLIEAITDLKPDIIAAGGETELARFCYEADLVYRSAGDIESALDQAIEQAGDRGFVAVLGSRAAAAQARSQILGLMPPDLRLN